jgi:homoserine kinase
LGERLASGTAHYDNVTAAYAGGFVIVAKDFQYAKIEAPRSLALCLVTPDVELPERKTRYARSLLPKKVALERMVDVTRAASLMVHGFSTGDVEEIGKAMAESPVDESRTVMIPHYDRVRRAALARGAAGVCISGAGPTLLAATERRQSAQVLNAMVKAFRSAGVACGGFVTGVGGGCRIVEER